MYKTRRKANSRGSLSRLALGVNLASERSEFELIPVQSYSGGPGGDVRLEVDASIRWGPASRLTS